MNSPRRTLLTITWYFCLSALILSAIPIRVNAQQPLGAHVRLHKRHWRPAHRSHLKQAIVLTGPISPGQSDYYPPITSRQPAKAAPTITNESIANSSSMSTTPAPVLETPKVSAAPAASAPIKVNPAVDPTVQTSPAAAAPVVKRKAPKQLTPLEMTRDAMSSTFAAANAQSLHDGGRLNVTTAIIRMLGSLLLVLLVILGAVKLLKRYNLVPNDSQGQMKNRIAQTPPALVAGNPVSAALMKGLRKEAVSASAVSPYIPEFELLRSLSLPGSSATIHLVRAAEKTLVLSTTPSSGVVVLTEVTAPSAPGKPLAIIESAISTANDDEEAAKRDEDAVTAFAEILREQTGLPVRADMRSLNQVDARLTSTQERLNARLKGGAVLSSAVLSVTAAPTRRRTSRTAQPKASDV